MSKLRHIGFCLLASVFFLAPTVERNATNEVKHQIQVIHPGISLTDPVEMTLVEDREGEETHFYMEVESVVCGDEFCRVDLLRVHWNELGAFERLELPPGVELEKAEGEAFTPEDYAQLETILRDRESPLREVYKWEIVGTEVSEGVDAITAATIALDKQAYVAGAVWTCYTLWHWVNGGMVDIIREISAAPRPSTALMAFLEKGDTDYQLFALEELTRRANYETATVAIVLDAMEANVLLHKPGLAYLEGAPTVDFQQAMERLLHSADADFRQLCWRAIAQTGHSLTLAFFESLSGFVGPESSYPEVQLFLRMLRERQVSSSLINERLAELLAEENFLVARSIYWYLTEQEVDKTVKVKLERFYEEHGDSL